MPIMINRWGVLAILCLFNFAIALTLQSIPPILSLIIDDLHISHAQAGLLMSAFVLPSIFLTIPLGLFSSHLGIKRIGLISLLLIILGSVLLITARSFPFLLLGRMVMGVGATALPIVSTQGVARTFINHRLGLAMGILSMSMPLSGIISYFTFGAAGIVWGWRAAILITMAVSIVTLLLFSIYFRSPAIERRAQGKIKVMSFSSLFKIGWPLWILALCWTLFLVGQTSLTTFLPDFMYQSGLGLSIAGSITGIIMLSSFILGPFTGFLLDRARYKEIFLIFSTVLGCIFTFILPDSLNYIIFIVIALGISIAPISPAVNAIVPSMVKHELLALAYSITFTLSSIGLFVGPYFTGLIRDLTGSYEYSFFFMALFFLFAAMIAAGLLLRIIKREKPT